MVILSSQTKLEISIKTLDFSEHYNVLKSVFRSPVHIMLRKIIVNDCLIFFLRLKQQSMSLA